jgi:hypothetical protein
MTYTLSRFTSSPLKWLVLYVALVPAFASGYSLLPPGSLHDSNIELEPSLVADAYRLLPSLTPTIRERVSDATWKASGFELRIVPGTVLVTGIDHSTDGRLLLKLDGECVTVGSNHPGVLSKFWEWVELSHESETVQHELSTLAYAGYEAVLVNGSESKAPAPLSPPVSALLPPAVGGPLPINRPGVGLFVVTPSANRTLVRFFKAAEGDPSFASGLWLRMLYLSETTITTLGLGDITPVSGTARLAVGLEPLIGIVLIGMFVNALAGVSRRPTTR